jgi:hypothetical protein
MKPREWLKWRKHGKGLPGDRNFVDQEIAIGICHIPWRRPERMVKISTYRFVVIVAFILGIVAGCLICW